MAKKTLPLRRLLVWLSLAGAGYVAVIGIYLQFFMLPTTVRLRTDTERVLQAQVEGVARIDALDRAVTRVDAATRDSSAGGAISSEAAARLEASVDSIVVASTPLALMRRIEGISDSVRVGLVTSGAAEAFAGEHLLAAIEALREGDRSRASGFIAQATAQRDLAEGGLARTRQAAITEVIRRERDLEATVGGAVLVLVAWGLAGSALLLGAFLILRVRLYRPLASIQSALERIADGDLSTSLNVVRDDELGRISEMVNRMTGVLADRERKEAERRQTVIERYGRILEEAATELVAFDASTFRVIDANRKAIVHLGYPEPTLAQMTAYDLWRSDTGVMEEMLVAVGSGDKEHRAFLAEQVRADGGTYPVEVTVFGAPNLDPPSIIAVIHDLTERRRLEDVQDQLARFALEKGALLAGGDLMTALKEITEMAVSALDVERASVWLYEGDQIRCVDEHRRSTGEHTAGAVQSEATCPRYFAAMKSERTIAVSDPFTDPRTSELAEGYLIPNGITAVLDAPLRVGGRVAGIMCHEHIGPPREWTPAEQVLAASLSDFVSRALETEERRRAEKALQASEQRYRLTFERAAVGVVETTLDGRFVHANPPLLAMLGYTLEELTGLTWRDVTHPDEVPDDQRTTLEILGDTAAVHHEKRLTRKDGTTAWVEVNTAPVRGESGEVESFVGVIQDVSEARDLQSQLAHAQRMDSIGRLAGGIAHDFNNLLTAILGHAEMGRATLTPDDPAYPDLREIEESALRATGLTRQLLTFARRQVVQSKTVDLDELTRGTERLLRRLIGENIELVTALRAEGHMVQIDPGQYEQVIVNLAVNARDAMPSGGRLTISSRRRVAELSPSPVTSGPTTECVELVVEDSGSGMPPEVCERIFEPFFTTKGAGEGIGLGLATSYGIIGQAGGTITVRSVVGEGTAFTILLPVVQSAPDLDDVREVSEPGAGGGETVLVVEDEEAVRRLVVEVLKRQGYNVLQAENGIEALEILNGNADLLDLMVTDIVMPRMGGPEVAERVREMRPDIKVLFMSGYSADTDRHQALAAEGTSFLPKPFTPTQLAARVRQLCDGDSIETAR